MVVLKEDNIMKIAISLSHKEVLMAQKVVEAIGGKTKELTSKIEGCGPVVNEVNYGLNGLEITTKISEDFCVDVYAVVLSHADAIKGLVATAKGLWATYMSLCKNIGEDIAEVSKKYFKA